MDEVALFCRFAARVRAGLQLRDGGSGSSGAIAGSGQLCQARYLISNLDNKK